LRHTFSDTDKFGHGNCHPNNNGVVNSNTDGDRVANGYTY
jgi:hypothetical protein